MNYTQLYHYVAQLLDDYQRSFTTGEIGSLVHKQTGYWPNESLVQKVCDDLRSQSVLTTVDFGDDMQYFEFVPKELRCN
jgi:hypothetical protein